MRWSAQSIRGFASLAGLTGASKLDTAVAIALAESGGNDKAVGKKGERGLWQIHGPSHPKYDTDRMFDPFENAKAMVDISKGGTDWTPWAAYNSGAYKEFLDEANEPVTFRGNVTESLEGIADAVPISDVPGAIAAAAEAPLKLLDWITDPGNILRIVKVVVGVGLVVTGLAIVARPVVAATPVGRVASVARKAVT